MLIDRKQAKLKHQSTHQRNFSQRWFLLFYEVLISLVLINYLMIYNKGFTSWLTADPCSMSPISIDVTSRRWQHLYPEYSGFSFVHWKEVETQGPYLLISLVKPTVCSLTSAQLYHLNYHLCSPLFLSESAASNLLLHHTAWQSAFCLLLSSGNCLSSMWDQTDFSLSLSLQTLPQIRND